MWDWGREKQYLDAMAFTAPRPNVGALTSWSKTIYRFGRILFS